MTPISRQEALAAGLKRYFTGKPCKSGHISERFVSTRGCVQCCKGFNAGNFARRYARDPAFVETRNAKSRAWAASNPEKNRARQAKWRAENPTKNREYLAKRNPERVREHAQRSRRKNKAKIDATIRDWKMRNPDRVRHLNHVGKARRRALEKNAPGDFTANDVADLYVRQSGRCAACPRTDDLQLDHIRALARGGSNDPTNLQLLCRPCNQSKGVKDMDEWLREHHVSTLTPSDDR